MQKTYPNTFDSSCEEPKYDYNSPNHKPPFINTDVFQMNGDPSEEVMKITIGAKGCHFCRITEQNNIPYIFHDKETNKINIWAPAYKASKVMREISKQMNYAKNIVKKKYEQTNNDT